jgi:hypothetical protein
VAEVRRKGDRTHAAGEQLQHGDVQVDEPFEREGDVPVQTVAEPPDAWRLTVGGGVGRDLLRRGDGSRCTLASMAGTALADPIARALVGVAAFCGPVTYTADTLHEGELLHPVFRVGATVVASMVGMRPHPKLGKARRTAHVSETRR